MKTRIISFSLLLLAISGVNAQEAGPWTAKWSNGYKIENSDLGIKMKFGGRMMWDNVFFFQDDSLEARYGAFTSGTEFRRLRFFNSGQIYGNVKYKVQLDFAGGKVSFKDAYIDLTGMPFGTLRIGHFKEPIRLEALTSSKYITFLERALPIDLLPERNTGLMVYHDFAGDRISWQGGIFRRSDAAGNDQTAGNGFALTTRISGLPLWQEENQRLLHLGVAASYRSPESATYEAEFRPETHLGNKYVSTGIIAGVKNTFMYNAEAAFVTGPFSIQAEYMNVSVSTTGASPTNYTFSSYYTQISYFLTGESRVYKGSLEGFDRVKPAKNFGKGPGAWEAALRLSSVDLNSADIAGGRMTNITAGINWYLNPASRIMANYVIARVKDTGNAGILQFRAQIDF